jgi:hypothetical protein
MQRLATIRRVPTAPTDEDCFIRRTTNAILKLIADLRRRLEHTGTRRSVAQALLAEAHIEEAVGLLKTIQARPGVREPAPDRPMPSMVRHACRQVQRPGRRHQAHGAGI